MKNLNLIGATVKDIENFLLNITLHTINITCETGEYGMIMFHRLVKEWEEKSGFHVKNEIYNEVLNPTEGQFIKYMMANGRVLLLLHNPELDNREVYSAIDKETGFPVESSTLYLKE